MIKNFVEELTWRGMIHDTMPGAEEHLMESMRSAYVGFDPTADSLHIGNLVPIMLLAHYQRCGHKPVALVGGATGMIGDPSGKSSERNLLDEKSLRHNQEAIKNQLAHFLDFDSDEQNAAELVNNYDWMKEFSFLDFIRDVGGFWKMGSGSLFRRVHKGMEFYTNGILGYVDVDDVVKGMIKLMESSIKNERYIMVAKNWSFKKFVDNVAENLNVNPPRKEAKPWQLQIAWRLDWLNYFFYRKYRKLTKQMAKRVFTDSHYSSDKIKEDLQFEFKPIEQSIALACQFYLEDLKA